MLERFDSSARQALAAAGQEAAQSRTGFIEPEHLLLGLLTIDIALANRLTAPLTIDQLRNRVNAPPPLDNVSSEPPPGYEFKRILAYAGGEATKDGPEVLISLAHLLIGILKEHDCWCSRELRKQLH